jgi:hypothetical protein
MSDTTSIQREVQRLLEAHYNELGGWLGLPPITPEFRPDGLLALKVALLVDAANHSPARAEGSEENISLAVDDVLHALHVNAWNAEHIDESFWQSEIGQVIERCQFWLAEDDLITHTEAAQMLRGSTSQADIMYVQRLIKRGKLTRYTDPNEPNPQRAGRVSRQEVEGLRDGFANGH